MKATKGVLLSLLLLVGSVVAGETNRFAIFLSSGTGTVETVALASSPVLTESDIISYDWSTHMMRLTENGKSRLPTPQQVGSRGMRFVVVADGARCYEGVFSIGPSSFGRDKPIIDVAFMPSLEVTIHRPLRNSGRDLPDEKDPRSDKRILGVMRELGKLKGSPNQITGANHGQR